MEIKTSKVKGNPGISIDYAGQGEMVIFLHGIGGNKKNWTENLIFFSSDYYKVQKILFFFRVHLKSH